MTTNQLQQKIFAHIKRTENPNIILFSSDPKRAEVLALFQERFEDYEQIEYSNEHSLAEDECWVVQLSDTQFELLDQQYVLNLDSTAGVNTGDIESANDNIRALYLANETQVVFKRIFKYQFMKDSSIFSLDGEPKVSEMHNALAVDDRVDAVLDVDARKLLFRSFNTAKQLFPCLIDFYRSATQEEVDQWMGSSIFQVDDNFNLSKVGATNRKKIAFALKDLEIALDNAVTVERIKEHATSTAIEGLFDGSAFRLTSNKDITEMMRIVTGAYHTNPITDDPMLAKTASKVNVEGASNE